MVEPRTPSKRKADVPTAEIRGEFFVHRYLWLAYMHFSDRQSTPVTGSAFPNMAALLTLYFALEGFLNYLGARVCPEAWQDERRFFSGGDYPGTLGKLDYLANELGVQLDRGSRPYQSLRELDKRRDALVHPRVENISRTVQLPDPNYMPPIEPSVFAIAEDGWLKLAGEDVESIADLLHHAAYKELGPGVIYGGPAFRGSVGYQTAVLPPPIG
jgi:hypothetical protein